MALLPASSGVRGTGDLDCGAITTIGLSGGIAVLDWRGKIGRRVARACAVRSVHTILSVPTDPTISLHRRPSSIAGSHACNFCRGPNWLFRGLHSGSGWIARVWVVSCLRFILLCFFLGSSCVGALCPLMALPAKAFGRTWVHFVAGHPSSLAKRFPHAIAIPCLAQTLVVLSAICPPLVAPPPPPPWA